METSWINRDLYPFQSRFLDLDGHRLHYIDEGEGTPIVFAHGTPEWSFGWRDVVKGLRGQYRCIAPDMLGFGLSDKPLDGDYTVQAHARRLEQFIDRLGLEQFHIVGNDFGLAIGLHYAIKHPDKVQKISFFNGWMWPLDSDPHYARAARVMRTWLGRLMYLRFNFPVRFVMPAAFGDKRKLSPEIHRHYFQALPTPDTRRAAYAFTYELLDAGPFWAELWQKVSVLAEKPALVFWGMKDNFVPPYELWKWEKALPHARVIRFPGAGHFVQEEEAETMVAELGKFFKS